MSKVKNTTNVAIEEQRKLGKFETPKHIAKFIVKWAIRKRDDLVLEPCVGSGILFFEAIQQLKQFHTSGDALKNVYGVDIDSVAVENVGKKIGPDLSVNSNVIHMDFLRTIPNKELPLVDVVICNPPYTRHQHLDQDYKKEIAKSIEQKTGIELSRQSSIYVYFLIHASRFLKEKGRMAFILPSNFLNVNYGVAVKKFLVDKFRIIAIILFPEKRLLFPNAITTTCIVFLEKKKNKKNVVKFLKLNSMADNQNLLSAIENPSLLIQKNWATVNKIRQVSLDPMKKWNHYFYPDIEDVRGLVPLKVVAKVKRGIATGANDFFTLSDEEVQKLGIEQRFLKPVLARARNAPLLDFTSKDFQNLRENGKKVWLVSSDLAKDKLRGTNLLTYIKQGEMEELHLRHLTRCRRIWYSSEKRSPSPIILTYMSRKKPRFIFNEAGMLVLNTFHFVYPEGKAIRNRVELKALLAYLNSNEALNLLRRVGRVYGGGLLKIEPRELERLPIMDFVRLADSNTEALANLFEQLCKSVRKGSGEQEILKEIDRLVGLLKKNLETKGKKGLRLRTYFSSTEQQAQPL
ncbi:MAG: N-6 DNA methylase [Candidatus Bathyarchaeota archaeon]|nr:MAG: N-6 DNA methylase [Candidatus Bathyarchaeota archaeon]